MAYIWYGSPGVWPRSNELGDRLATEFGVLCRAVAVDLSEEDFLGKIDLANHDLDIGVVVSSAGTLMISNFLAMDYGTPAESASQRQSPWRIAK